MNSYPAHQNRRGEFEVFTKKLDLKDVPEEVAEFIKKLKTEKELLHTLYDLTKTDPEDLPLLQLLCRMGFFSYDTKRWGLIYDDSRFVCSYSISTEGKVEIKTPQQIKEKTWRFSEYF